MYTAKANDTSNSLASEFGLSSSQLTALNPDGFDDSGAAVVGAQLCIGGWKPNHSMALGHLTWKRPEVLCCITVFGRHPKSHDWRS